jgi:hypothetical protein
MTAGWNSARRLADAVEAVDHSTALEDMLFGYLGVDDLRFLAFDVETDRWNALLQQIAAKPATSKRAVPQRIAVPRKGAPSSVKRRCRFHWFGPKRLLGETALPIPRRVSTGPKTVILADAEVICGPPGKTDAVLLDTRRLWPEKWALRSAH